MSPPEDMDIAVDAQIASSRLRHVQRLSVRRLWIAAENEGRMKEIEKLSAAHRELEERIKDLLAASRDVDDTTPPELAELLLTFFARASQDEFAAGDMGEIFVRDCVEWGRSRAGRLYWASVLGYLLQRSLRLAALAGIIRKLFVG
jgi:hypothetical protein